MSKIIKLSLYIKFNNLDQNLKFDISPAPLQISDNLYEFNMCVTDIFKFKITLSSISLGSALIIEKIVLNEELLNFMDLFGVYRVGNMVKKTNGYMDEKGTYQFKIRYNALSQNYLTFLIDN